VRNFYIYLNKGLINPKSYALDKLTSTIGQAVHALNDRTHESRCRIL